MESNWAVEHLQTIRTLMERSAIYRRALAPISTYVGVVGVLAGLIGWQAGFESTRAFTLFWMAVSLVASTGAFLLVRRQAIRDSEPLWSPPTRRVAQAMIPAFFVGLVSGILFMTNSAGPKEIDHEMTQEMQIVFWMLLYGFALHSAGFFAPRGMKLLGWAFIVLGTVMVVLFRYVEFESPSRHLQMGVLFGGSHLAYGIYLYFTEKRKNAT